MSVDIAGLGTAELGSSLVDGQRQRDRGEAEWLAWLAEFDLRAGWAADGSINCVGWLVHRCGMSRPTAKEKLRVALRLRVRPVLYDGLAGGRLSYSKVRALC